MFNFINFQQSVIILSSTSAVAIMILLYYKWTKTLRSREGQSKPYYNLNIGRDAFHLHHWRFTFFQIGVALSLSCTLVAFNHSTSSPQVQKLDLSFNSEDLLEIDIPRIPEERPVLPPPPIKTPRSTQLEIIDTDFEPTPIQDEKPIIEYIPESNGEPSEGSIVKYTAPIIPPPPPADDSDDLEIVLVPQEMPRFPGCEELPKNERDQCAQKALLKYLSEQIKYPEIARQNNIHGTCVVSFVVSAKGKLKDITLRRDIGGGCGQEALRVVQEMSENQIWIPGKQRGRRVPVQFNLPVKFKLR